MKKLNKSLSNEANQNTKWWHSRFGYEIYPRTFCDSNGDGIGDIAGIESKLDYLKDIGIGVIWICPFYQSPGFDCGYDVSDYFSIDPEIGTISEFESLIESAHEKDIAVLIDIVPNHTSHLHKVFQKALEDPNSPERDMYIFRDPSADGGPPNNWLSVFGGSAWELDEKSGQYYLHMFYPEQPDLNWRNPAVHEMFEGILRFWFEKGIDGFRIDVTQGLYKHPDFPDAKEKKQLDATATEEEKFSNLDDSYYYCLPETPLVFENWRKISDEYDGVLMGEMVETTPERLSNYFNGKGLDLVTYLTSTRANWEPERLVEIFAFGEKNFFGNIAWMMCNHDWSRTTSRFGEGSQSLQRALTTSAFTACVSGLPFLYYGEELGWENSVVQDENIKDPRGLRFPDSIKEGRDPFRTNMAWDSVSKNQGFSSADKVWLEATPRKQDECVATQIEKSDSPLAAYMKIIELRKMIGQAANTYSEDREWLQEDRFIGFQIDDYFVGMNTDSISNTLEKTGEWELVYSSEIDRSIPETTVDKVIFPAESTVVYKRKGSYEDSGSKKP